MAARLFYKFKRVLPLALLLVYLAQFAAFVIQMGGIDPFVRATDFMPNLVAAEIIHAGQGPSLYDLDVQHEVEQRIVSPYRSLAAGEILPYNHLPFEVFLIAPLIILPYGQLMLYWTMLLAFALCVALYLLQKTLSLKQPWLVVMVICAISYQPVFRAFVLGQNSAIVLLGVCLTFAARKREGWKWQIPAGFGLVLVAFKPQLLPLVVLMMAMEGRWWALFWFVIEFAFLTVVAMPIVGVMWPLRFVELLQQISGWSSNAAINPAIMQNWRGFAADTVGIFSITGARVLYALVTALSLLLFFYAWWSGRVQKKGLSEQPDMRDAQTSNLLWALGIVTAILVAPHLNVHDLMLLIFPAWVMVYTAQQGELSPKVRVLWLPMLKMLYLLMAVAFLAGAALPIWVIFNVSLLAFGTALLLVAILSTQKGQGPITLMARRTQDAALGVSNGGALTALQRKIKLTLL